MSVAQAAAAAGTTPHVIAALERGRFHDLPSWPETYRAVGRYAAFAGVDPAPVLEALARHARPGAARAPASGRLKPRHDPSKTRSPIGAKWNLAARALPPLALNRVRQACAALPARLLAARGWRPRRLLTTAGLLALLLIAFPLLATAQAGVPGPVARLFTQIGDQMRVMLAPKRDGFTWVEVSDPRQRRGDKLQTARH